MQHTAVKRYTSQIFVVLSVLYLRLFLYVSFFSCLWSTSIQAQLRYLQGAAHIGTIINHNSDISFDTKAASFGADIGMYWQTKGDQDWHQKQNFPRLHLTASYQDLGKKDVVGSAFMLTGGIEVPIFRKSASALHFGFGSGFGYLTRPYDRISNPSNNAIGSHLNNTVTLKLDYERLLSQNSIVHIGIKLFHYSNGARQLPNLGLNIPSLYVGFSPHRGSYEKDFYQYSKSNKRRPKQKYGLAVHAHYAQVEIRVTGGPNYPVYVLGLDGYFSPNTNHRFSLGYQYDYNSSIEAFGLQTGDFADLAEARIGAARHSISTGNEFLFGPWAVQLKVGVYIQRRLSFLTPRPFYFQLAPRYYFNSKSSGSPKVFASIQLKSHLFVAEHISFGLGMVF